MQELLKKANKRLAKLEKFNRGKGRMISPTLAGGGAAQMILGGAGLRKTSKNDRHSKLERSVYKGQVGLGALALGGSAIHTHQSHKANKLYGHLSDTELDKRIKNG